MALLAAYNFEETSGGALDRSGNGRDFALTGTSARTAPGDGYTYGGEVPSAKGLTQTAAEVQAGPPVTGLNSSNRTVMAWVKLFNVSFNGWFMEYHRAAENTGVWGFLCLFSVFRFRGKDSANTAYDITIPADPGNWHHIAATHDGTTLRVYRDGALLDSVAMPAVWAGDTIRALDGVGANGVLEEVRLYDETLDAATIASLMNTPVTAGPEPVEELSGTLALTLDTAGELTPPPAELSGSLAVTLDTTGALTVPPASTESLQGSLPLTLSTTGILEMPPASVENLAGSLELTLSLDGTLSDPNATDGDYTAEIDHVTYSASASVLEYTAELGA